jgi:polyphenol oxidase
VIKSTKQKITADGHWSTEKKVALVIRTADCLPVFYAAGPSIVALHIGWRGLKQKILSHSLTQLTHKQKPNKIFVGPHIAYNSFQLDQENSQGLIAAHNIPFNQALKKDLIRPSLTQPQHFHLNLVKILQHEALSLGIKQVINSPIDTYLSPSHHSFRRNRLTQKRNLSFIYQT